MNKLNCWEIKECGREPGGSKCKELGVCPAAIDTSSNGTNSGKNGGRICWGIAGTLCSGQICGTHAHTQSSCMTCDVFNKIRQEEGPDFSISTLDRASQSPVLLRMLLYNFARHEMK